MTPTRDIESIQIGDYAELELVQIFEQKCHENFREVIRIDGI